MAENEPTGTEMIQVNAQVGMDEMVSIKLSEYENQLLAREQELIDQADGLNKAIAAEARTIADKAKKAIKADWAKPIAALTKALEPFKAAAARDASTSETSIPTITINDPNSNGWADVDDDEEVKLTNDKNAKITATLSFNIPGNSYGSMSLALAVPDAVKPHVKNRVKLAEQLAAINVLLANVRSTLGKMSFAERQLKGRVARLRLSQSEQGKGILSEMDKVSISDIIPGAAVLALPKK